MQKVCEILNVRATTDDDLIAHHLKCLAEWSVRIIVYSVIIDVVVYREVVTRKMAYCPSVLGTYRARKL